MKKRTLRVLSAAMAVVMAALMLAACKPQGGADVTTPVSTAEPAPADFTVVRDGASEFRIVRPSSDGSEETEAARDLRAAIEEKTGVKLEICEDWYAKSQTPVKYEILVGHTDCDESVAVNGEIDAEDGFFYVIRSVGDKIVVTGKSANMIKKAIDFIIENYADGNGNITIPHDINVKSEMFTPAEQADPLDDPGADPVGRSLLINLHHRLGKHVGGVVEAQMAVEVPAEVLRRGVVDALVQPHHLHILRHHIDEQIGGQTL